VAACPDRAAYSHAERIPQARADDFAARYVFCAQEVSPRCLFTAQEYRYGSSGAWPSIETEREIRQRAESRFHLYRRHSLTCLLGCST